MPTLHDDCLEVDVGLDSFKVVLWRPLEVDVFFGAVVLPHWQLFHCESRLLTNCAGKQGLQLQGLVSQELLDLVLDLFGFSKVLNVASLILLQNLLELDVAHL